MSIFVKFYLGPDRPGVTFAEVLTDGNVGDVKTALNLVAEVGSDIASFTADAAYDAAAHLRCASSTQHQSRRFADQDSSEIEAARHPAQCSRSHKHEGEEDRSQKAEAALSQRECGRDLVGSKNKLRFRVGRLRRRINCSASRATSIAWALDAKETNAE
jgi:hypothetical protein